MLQHYVSLSGMQSKEGEREEESEGVVPSGCRAARTYLGPMLIFRS